jgi:hypothetical protein
MHAIYSKLQEIKLPGLRVANSIELWWWTGAQWEHITSPGQCSDMPRGIRFGPCEYCGDPVAWYRDESLSYNYRWGRIAQMHCCSEQCRLEHADIDGCLYWLVRGGQRVRRRAGEFP